MTLFTPDTLIDGYERSLLRCMNRLSLRQNVISTIKVMRVSHPQVYCRLCYLAHEHGHDALYQAVRILDELGQLPEEKDESE